MNILPPASYESLYVCFVSRLSARAAAKKCNINRGTAALYYRKFKNGEHPSAQHSTQPSTKLGPADFPPGCRVRLNETYIYGGAGQMGTVIKPSREGWDKGMGWLEVRMDDSPYVGEWHYSYFDRQSSA